VAEISSAADLASMSSAVDDAVAAQKNSDFDGFLDANRRFHNAWRALVPNRRMSKLLDQYVGHVRFLRVLTLGDPLARKVALTGMKNIHAAFRKRDADAAADAMHKQLEAAKHFLIKVIEQINKEKEAEKVTVPAA
jgi:DNA-binding GntR family transcriptional regulator